MAISTGCPQVIAEDGNFSRRSAVAAAMNTTASHGDVCLTTSKSQERWAYVGVDNKQQWGRRAARKGLQAQSARSNRQHCRLPPLLLVGHGNMAAPTALDHERSMTPSLRMRLRDRPRIHDQPIRRLGNIFGPRHRPDAYVESGNGNYGS